MNNRSLPPALDKFRHDLTEEVGFARSLTPEQRLEVLAKVCRSDLELLKLNERADRLLKQRDPVPPSTVKAFKRLTSCARH